MLARLPAQGNGRRLEERCGLASAFAGHAVADDHQQMHRSRSANCRRTGGGI